jgi:hypothetical protein
LSALIISDADWRLRKSDQELVERGLGYAEFDFILGQIVKVF